MNVAVGNLLTENPWVRRRPLSVAEYHRMAEVGILTPDDRVELIEGELVEMAAMGGPHVGAVIALNRLFSRAAGSDAVVSVQMPVQLGEGSEPEPDIALLRPRADDYRRAVPHARDVLLLIEVSDTTIEYDRRVKSQLYAREGVPELWIVDVGAGRIEVYQAPGPGGYASVRSVGRGEVLSPAALPRVTVAAADILGEPSGDRPG